MKFVIIVDLDTNKKNKQVKITPKFIIWQKTFTILVNIHLICLGYILHTTRHIILNLFLTYSSKILFLCKLNIA